MTSSATHTATTANHTPIRVSGMQVSSSARLATRCAETQAGRAFPKTEEGYWRAEMGYWRAETRYCRPPFHHFRAEVGICGAEDPVDRSHRDCCWPEGRSPSAEKPYCSVEMHHSTPEIPSNPYFTAKDQRS